ncbi:MAG: ABC transporter ATP-binding protein [Candidatus Cyclobacteriaceae bacterium M3_2C_046]
MIKISQISKSYPKVKALDQVSFEVNQGELFGLIGPDGAGKTTLFRILTTLILPDQGNAEVASFDMKKDFKKIRKHVGYMPGKFSLYMDLSVEENLQFFATTFGTTIDANYELIKDIYSQIEPFKKRKAGALSGGMKQKLALSCALIHRPKVLFLDEPTTGVDPVSRREFWDILKGLKKYNITILVSTPYMDEANRCERVALIQKGKLMSIDTPEAIRKDFSRHLYSVKTSRSMYQLLQDLKNYDHSRSVYVFGEEVHYTDRRANEIQPSLQKYLEGNSHQQVDIKPIEANIEDRFMELMDQNEAGHA